MPYEVLRRDDEICLQLEGRLSVSAVRSIYDDIRREIADGGHVIVDVALCDRVDTSIIQLLQALKIKMPETKIVNRSAGFEESLARVGQAEAFEDENRGSS